MKKSIPDLTINPHAPGFLMKNQGNYGFFDPRIRIESEDDFIKSIPDGIFTIWHKGLEKGLLFFLEVDMDTESVASQISLTLSPCPIPPSDFIWLTNQEQMFSDGLSAEIWVRGGKTDRPLQSIIGSDMATATLVMHRIRQT